MINSRVPVELHFMDVYIQSDISVKNPSFNTAARMKMDKVQTVTDIYYILRDYCCCYLGGDCEQ